MVDDVLLNKAAIIERCVARTREEYIKNPATFGDDFTRQDAAVLNIQRACEACLDIGQVVIRRHHLGLPQSARDILVLLVPHRPLADPPCMKHYQEDRGHPARTEGRAGRPRSEGFLLETIDIMISLDLRLHWVPNAIRPPP